MMDWKAFIQYIRAEPLLWPLLYSVFIVLVLMSLRGLFLLILRKRIKDSTRLYHWRRIVVYCTAALMIILIGHVWFPGMKSLATFFGLVGAGLAVAMHDSIANVAGWAFIMSLRPMEVGDRIEIGGVSGDVIDIRLFQFSVIEIKNWIDAEQSTGRIIHIPNSKVLREPLANYETGFKYLWHEIPVLITFESNWEKAKEILEQISRDVAEPLSEGAAEEIRQASRKYLIFFNKLTPIVYLTVRDSGVLLTIRYITQVRKRRGTENNIWTAILTEFDKHPDVELAYPTTRFYQADSVPERKAMDEHP